MPLTHITLSGADENTRIDDLVRLGQRHPFVEFGILASSNYPRPRYGSPSWIREARDALVAADIPMSLHLCGHYARDILAGVIDDYHLGHLDGIRRIQINAGPFLKDVDPNKFTESLMKYGGDVITKTWIIQVGDDHVNGMRLVNHLRTFRANVNILFDASGGRGISPVEWPKPVPGVLCGFAGGLKPEPLAGQVEHLLRVNGEVPFFIDMESGLRDKYDTFSIDKCVQVIDTAYLMGWFNE